MSSAATEVASPVAVEASNQQASSVEYYPPSSSSSNLPRVRKTKLPFLRLSQPLRRRRRTDSLGKEPISTATATSLPPATRPETPTTTFLFHHNHHRRRWSFPKRHFLFHRLDHHHHRNETSLPQSQEDSAIVSLNNNAPSTHNNNEMSLSDPIVTKYESVATPTTTTTPTTITANNSSNNSKEDDHDNDDKDDDDDPLVETDAIVTSAPPSLPRRTHDATAILQHSYLEYVCGCGNQRQPTSWDMMDENNNNNNNNDDSEEDVIKHQQNRLSEDPTVQESIECVFASQLQEGLPQALWDDEDDDEDQPNNDSTPAASAAAIRTSLMSPASLLQSRVSSRSSLSLSMTPATISPPARVTSICRGSSVLSGSSTTAHLPKKLYQTASLIHMGTLDPHQEPLSPEHKPLESSVGAPAPDATSTRSSSTFVCPSCSRGQHSPWIDPNDWPQSPLLLKPTPDSGTRILGVRYSRDEAAGTTNKYLWKPSDSYLWNQPLLQEWGRLAPRTEDTTNDTSATTPGWCEFCCILPINNGNEENGKSLLVDFESEYFVGSLLLRLRHSEGTTPEPYNDQVGYFLGMNRRYQAVVQGRFKQSLPWTSLVTGFQLERPCGKLPPKWILKSALKVVSFFAPQLDAKLDVDKPSSLTPLGSTPQVINVHDRPNKESTTKEQDRYLYREDVPPPLDMAQVEPTLPQHTLLGQASDASTSFQRSRFRKRAFDKLYVQHQHYQQQLSSPTSHSPPPPQLLTDPSKIYTMEFLQHLFNFQDFSMELGSMLGSVKLKEILDGQPIQFMACISSNNKDDDGEEEERRRRQRLWSFDIWHSSLMDDAKKHDPVIM